MRKNLSLILAIISALSGLGAYYFGMNNNILLLVAAILLLIFLIAYEHFETKSGKGTSYSIYDKFKGLFLDQLKNPERNKFKGRFENLLLVGINEENSKQKIDEISQYYASEVSIKQTIFLIPQLLKSIDEEKNKEDLQSKLKSSDGVIFVRTKTFDKYVWIIDIIDNWAMKNSSFAVLRIDYLVENEDPNFSNQKAQHFQLIPITTEPNIIPWHLFSRVNERSAEWRSQAGFNRIMAFFMVASLFLFSMAYLLKTKSAKIAKMKSYDLVLNSEKRRLKEKFPDLKSLELSVWAKSGNKCFEIAKTHAGQVNNYSIKVDSSLIGYSMQKLNIYYLWTDEKQGKYLDVFGNKEIDGILFPIYEHKFKTIVAISLSQFDNKIMGICADISYGVDTTMRKEIFSDEIKNILIDNYFNNTK